MRQSLLTSTMSLLALICAAGAAHASSFTLLATLGTGASIGAVKGTTLYGTDNAGDLFSLTPGGTVTVLHNFPGGSLGGPPNPRLAIDGAGALFGTSPWGGTYNGGTLWKYAGGTVTALHSFGGSGDGTDPMQGPTLDGKGTLVGSTAGGAVNTNGNIFSYHNGHYTALHNFLSGTDGHCPFSGVASGANRVLYGTTVGNGFGGNPNGSVWEMTPAGKKSKLTTIYLFQDGADGQYPNQAPAVDAAGNVYGTTYIQSGNGFPGAIYKISPTGGSVLHSFVSGTDGYGPNSPLILNTDGKFYGTTASGGPNGHGTVFSITTDGTFTMVYAFTGGADGATPSGNLANDTSGAIYGGTQAGTLFKIVP